MALVTLVIAFNNWILGETIDVYRKNKSQHESGKNKSNAALIISGI